MSYELTIKHEPGKIQCDTEGLAKYVESQIQKYDGLVFQESEIKDAKQTMADLNKIKTLIEDRRKDIKKEITQPYTEFEVKIKPIVKRIDEVRGKIKTQVEEYEQRIADEKKHRICDWWAENGKSTVPIEKIWDERWLNKTYSDSQWQNDLTIKKNRISADLAMIVSLGDPVKTDFMIPDYLKTMDISSTMQNWERHEQALKAAEEERQRIEQERAERAARQAAEQAKREAEQAELATAENVPAEPGIAPQAPETAPQGQQKDDPNDYLYSPTFQMIDLTYAQALSLTNFMKNSGMKFRSIAKDRRKK